MSSSITYTLNTNHDLGATPFNHSPYLDVGHAHHATAVVHVLFEVHLDILEDEGERARGVDDVMEGDNVGVLQVFEEGDFSDGRAGSAFLMF